MNRGDRVRLSDQAKKMNISNGKNPERRGIFMGLEKGFYIKVLWDGNKSPGTGYHPDFIERAPAVSAAPHLQPEDAARIRAAGHQ